MSTILEKCSFNYDQPCRGMVSGKKKKPGLTADRWLGVFLSLVWKNVVYRIHRKRLLFFNVCGPNSSIPEAARKAKTCKI